MSDAEVRAEAEKWVRPWVLGCDVTMADANRVTEGIVGALASAGLLRGGSDE